MADEKKMTAAYKRLEAMQQDVETMLGEASDHILCKGSEFTIKDLVDGYHNFLTQLTDALGEKVDVTAGELEAVRKAKTEAEKARDTAQAEAKDAEGLQLPEGALVTFGEKPNELSIITLRKASEDLLEKLVKLAGEALAGGSDDTLAAVERVAPGKKAEFYGEVIGFEGYPQLGTAITKGADEAGRLTKATTPKPDEDPLSAVGKFLAKAGAKGKSVRVDLT